MAFIEEVLVEEEEEERKCRRPDIKPLTSSRKTSKSKKVAVMQTSQELQFPIKDIFFLIEFPKFFHQRNPTVPKVGLISSSLRVAIQDPTETICCPLDILVRKALDKRNWA